MNALTLPKPVARIIVLLVAGLGAVLSSGTHALAQPLFGAEITPIAPQGFGDQHNSQAWSMAWWNGKLYVGTGRATFCVQQATLEYFKPEGRYYPPRDKDVSCTPDPHDLPLQAEIWRYTPETSTWERVYQSPNDVPIQGTDPQKYTARDIGYRGMLVFTHADGTTALYVAGDSTRAAQGVGFNGPVPPPRILRSFDGVTFEALPFDPDQVPGSPLVSGFRSLRAYKGNLYVAAPVGQLGHGIILEATGLAADPNQGTFRMISPLRPDGKPMTFFEIEVYNGYLWAGTGVQPQNDDTPFSLMKTDATGDPYTFTTVIPEGAYKKRGASAAVISLSVFGGRLYVGTDRELLRVNPDDTWDLVVGTPRKKPDGSKLQPLSGFDNGFDNFFNIHMWRMSSYAGWLYLGTQDQSAKWRNLKGGIGDILKPGMGFDLFATSDGWHYSGVSRNGLGDMFNNGMRNLVAGPTGLYLGSANHHYGTWIYKGANVAQPVGLPMRLEAESAPKIAAITWEGSPTAVRFHVYRSSGFGSPVEIGAPGTDCVTSPATCRSYVDQTIKLFKSYHYYVVAEDALGNLSEPSNMVRVPFKGPVPTFKSLETLLASWSAPAALTTPLAEAKAAVEASDFPTALAKLQAMGALIAPPTQTLLPPHRAQDLGVLLLKFTRRVLLVQAGGLPVRAIMR